MSEKSGFITKKSYLKKFTLDCSFPTLEFFLKFQLEPCNIKLRYCLNKMFTL